MTYAHTAAAGVLTVPIPPGHEGLIQALTSPLPAHGPLGEEYGDARLQGIQINPWSVDFVVASQRGEARVRWSISRDTLTSRVELIGIPSAGARALADAVETNSKRIGIRRRASPPKPPKKTAPSSPDREPSSGWVLIATILYAGGLIAGRRHLAEAVGTIRPAEGISVAVLAALCACLISALPDTVVYHRGHGWRWVQTVAGETPVEPHNGVIAVLASRLLGFFGGHGAQAHIAANVAYVLAIPAGWLWARALWRKGYVAVWCAGLLATQPALVYLGGSHYPGSVGLAVLLVAGFHLTAAARAGTWGTIAAASGAMAWLLNWRFSGLVVAPGVFLIGLSVALRSNHSRPVWLAFAAGGTVAISLAAAHWYGVFELAGVRTDIKLASLEELWRANFMVRGHAASPALAVLTAAGLGAAWWWSRGRKEAPAFVGLAAGLLALIVAPLWFGLTVSNGLLDELRYCSWAIPGCALAASATAFFFSPGLPVRIQLASLTAVTGLVIFSVIPGAKLLAIEHPEQLQLRLLDELGETLPQGATVAYPRQRGLHLVSLPLLPLQQSRPDLRFVAVSEPNWQKQADYWLEPLICHMPRLFEPSDIYDAPDACMFGGKRTPVYRLAVTLERVPSFDNAERPSMFATDGYWVSPPVVTPNEQTPYIGLYKPR